MEILNNTTAETAENELIISRMFDAPVELVYKVWTEPQHVKKWWGPAIFTAPVVEIDLRPGGAYLFVMRGPDGTDYPMTGIYKEIIANERIVYTVYLGGNPEEWKTRVGKDDESAMQSLVTVSFESLGDKTKATINTRFASNAIRDNYINVGMIPGWTSSLQKFEAELLAISI